MIQALAYDVSCYQTKIVKHLVPPALPLSFPYQAKWAKRTQGYMPQITRYSLFQPIYRSWSTFCCPDSTLVTFPWNVLFALPISPSLTDSLKKCFFTARQNLNSIPSAEIDAKPTFSLKESAMDILLTSPDQEQGF